MNLFFFIFNLIIVFFIAVMSLITPMLNRRSLLFGVRIPESVVAKPECQSLRSSYFRITVMGCSVMMALAVIQYVIAPQFCLLAMLYFPFLMILVQFAAFIPQWQKALSLKQEKGWDVPLIATMETRSASDRQNLTTLPWGWYFAGILLVLALTMWTLSVYPSVPDRIITHWNATMQPDAWADKNMLSVMMMPLMALSMVAVMAVSNIVIYKLKLQISAEYPALSFAQHRLYRRMMSHSLGFFTLCLTIMFILVQPVSLNLFTPSASYLATVIMVTCLLGIIPIVFVPIKAGQSGCKLKPMVSHEDELSEKLSAKVKVTHPGRNDDRYWKLGLFYCNPDDPAVLIEDRFGGNVGFNYSRLPAKLFVIALTALLVVIYLVSTVSFLQHPLI